MGLNAFLITPEMPPDQAYQLGYSDAEAAQRAESAGESDVWLAKLERTFARFDADPGAAQVEQLENEVAHTLRLAAARDKATAAATAGRISKARAETAVKLEEEGPRESWKASLSEIPCAECGELGETRHTVTDQHVCLVCIALYPEKKREWAPMPPAAERHRRVRVHVPRPRGRGGRAQVATYEVDGDGRVYQRNPSGEVLPAGLVCAPLAGRTGVTADELLAALRSLAATPAAE